MDRPVAARRRRSEYDPGLAIKFTIRRDRPSGSPGERDVFGAQQYAPLFDLPIPVDSTPSTRGG
jgi:Domain of unknown function (DUF4387)